MSSELTVQYDGQSNAEWNEGLGAQLEKNDVR